MLSGEVLQIKFYKAYGNMAKKGLKEFIDIIDFEDSDIKDNLSSSIDDKTLDSKLTFRCI